MLKTVYDHYVVLYDQILPAYPHLAHDHALKHEEHVYRSSNKFTYRNVYILFFFPFASLSNVHL
jgi:RNA exonuclease 1